MNLKVLPYMYVPRATVNYDSTFALPLIIIINPLMLPPWGTAPPNSGVSVILKGKIKHLPLSKFSRLRSGTELALLNTFSS